MRRRGSHAVAFSAATTLVGVGDGPDEPTVFLDAWADGVREGNVSFTSDWQEISGITRGVRTENVGYLWMQSDGSINKLLAVRTSKHASGFNGAMGEWTLQGVTGVDFEDITSGTAGGVNYLYLWDGGNNSNGLNSRGAGIDACIYRIKEPAITGSNGTILSADIEKIDVAYPAANIPSHRDAETLMFDPITEHLYILTKRVDPPQMYRLAHQTSYVGIQNLTFAGAVISSVYPFTNNFEGSANGGHLVGGDISPDGSNIVLKSYTQLFHVPRNIINTVSVELQNNAPTVIAAYVGGGRPSSMWDNEPQGEACCWDWQGFDIFTFSEAGTPNQTGASASNFPLRRYDMLTEAYQSTEFQQGNLPTGAYAGTVDTYIMVSTPGTTRGTETTFVADKDYTGVVVTDERISLLKFDLSSIPPISVVVGVDLFLTISAEGQDFEIFACYVAWNTNSTYTSLGGLGIPQDDVSSSSAYVSRHGAPLSTVDNHGYDTITGVVTCKSPEMVALVQSWIDGSRVNNGFVIKNSDSLATTKGDGFQFHSAEAAVATNRPKLVVRYI